jgi:flagellar basal body-associated protein FliL
MASRKARWAILLPVVVTVLLATAVGVLVVVQHQREADQVAAADGVAEDFQAEVAAFRSRVAAALRTAQDGGPGALRKALEPALADPPELDEAPTDADESASYAVAEQTERTFRQPYQRLRRELRRAEVGLAFVAAARDALSLRASDYVDGVLLDDSGAVRSRLIPAFAAARDELAALRVPKGQEKLAADVVGALQYVVDGANQLANSIDANRSYTFSYSNRFRQVSQAVDDYATTAQGDVTEAVSAVTNPR